MCVNDQNKSSFKSGQIYRKDAHCSESDFLVHEYFFVRLLVFDILSILCMVDFEVCDLMYAKSIIYKIDHISKTKSRTKN